MLKVHVPPAQCRDFAAARPVSMVSQSSRPHSGSGSVRSGDAATAIAASFTKRWRQRTARSKTLRMI